MTPQVKLRAHPSTKWMISAANFLIILAKLKIQTLISRKWNNFWWEMPFSIQITPSPPIGNFSCKIFWRISNHAIIIIIIIANIIIINFINANIIIIIIVNANSNFIIVSIGIFINTIDAIIIIGVNIIILLSLSGVNTIILLSSLMLILILLSILIILSLLSLLLWLMIMIYEW